MIAISEGTVAAITAMLALDLFVIFFALSYTRARRRAPTLAPGTGGAALPPQLGARRSVTRREFFRRSLVSSLAVFGAQFGGASLAFMWPNLKGGFGAVIAAGKIEDIKNQISSSGEPFYMGAGRFYVVTYRGSGKDPSTGADYVGENVTTQGLMPLYQRCVHLGCRVPYCKASGWFECPCHGSKYNAAGEYELGPAPRGLDRFQIDIDPGGNVFVDTSQIILGPPRGTDTIDEPPQGPFCVATG